MFASYIRFAVRICCPNLLFGFAVRIYGIGIKNGGLTKYGGLTQVQNQFAVKEFPRQNFISCLSFTDFLLSFSVFSLQVYL